MQAWRGQSRVAWLIAVGWALLVAAACRGSVGRSVVTWPLPALFWLLAGSGSLLAWGVDWWSKSRDGRVGKIENGGEQDLFLRARTEYLKGDWFAAQRLLEHLLHRQSDFLPGRLLYATLLRRMGQRSRAEEELQAVEVLPDADRWRLEIDRERQWLARGQADDSTASRGEGEAA